jgi:hypothetical protein
MGGNNLICVTDRVLTEEGNASQHDGLVFFWSSLHANVGYKFGKIRRVMIFNLALITSVLFVLSMTLIPVLERLILRDLICRAEREGGKIEAIRDKIEFKVEKKNHPR